MPRISQFFGIAIAMYFNDHAPPHFHARYGAAEAAFVIDTLEVLWGTYPEGLTPWCRNGLPYIGLSYKKTGNALGRACPRADGADIDPDVLYEGLVPAWRESKEAASR